jgi:integrase
MKLWDLSQTYARLNLFNEVTRETLLRAVDLFIRRANIENCEEVNLEAILRFKEATLLVAKGVSYNGYLRYLRIIGRHAVEMGYMETNWFARVKLAPVGKPIPKTLDSTAVFAALQHIEAHSDSYEPVWFWSAVIKFLWHTGMRRRQIVTLRIGDFDLESSVLRLSFEGSKTRREWFIPLHDELIPIIEHMFAKVAQKLGRSLKADDTFFNRHLLGFRFSTDPKKLDAIPAQVITDFFKRINKRAGIVIGAHRFRHTFATELCNHVEGAVDLFTVQHLLGHSALQTTRIYVQSSAQTMFNSIRKIKPLRLNMKK